MLEAHGTPITVTRIDLNLVSLPLVHAFETSSHRKDHLEHIVVKVVDDAGHAGWGECASPTDPYYGPETVESCWAMIRDYFAPLLLGRPWRTPAEAERLWHVIRGNDFARAALDIACWDLAARRAGTPLAELIGGEARQVPAGVSLGIEPTIDDLLGQVRMHADAGYRRVKLKIRPGWDVAAASAVRESFPELDVQVDANGAYRETGEDLATLVDLDSMGLLMIEQPFEPEDLLAHARLAGKLETPVCLDESATSVDVARTALAVGAADIVNIKVSRLGGLGPAIAVHDLCVEHDVPVWCGGMHEFGVGRAANVALASLPGFVLPSDVSGSDKYFERDIVDPPIRAHDGEVQVPWGRPGIGHEVDEDLVDSLAVRKLSLFADAA